MRDENKALAWQSKAVLLIVVPWTVLSVVIHGYWWASHMPVVAWESLGISAVFGLAVWRMKAATPAGAATGAVITASLMFATARFPYEWSWLHGGLMPLLAVFLLTFAATKIGRAKKERIGTAESRRGRNAVQVAANLGAAVLLSTFPFELFTRGHISIPHLYSFAMFFSTVALSEAAADTVSSEIGQVFGGEPRLITTLKKVARGTDGGITFAGTLAGAGASLVVMFVGISSSRGAHSLEAWDSILIGATGGTFGLLFDSLLGATFERRGWLNNDAVNFLSTFSSWTFVMAAMVALLFVEWFPRLRF